MGLDIIALALSAASTAASFYSAQQQTKAANENARAQAEQARLNAEAAAKAKDVEAAQQANELSERQRRTMLEQKRFRATQLADMSGQGIAITGTPLDILANTAVQQQQELHDASYQRDTIMRNLAYEKESALAMGRVNANNALMGMQRGPSLGATILSGASQMAGIFAPLPKSSTKLNNLPIPAGYKPKPVSARPAGY
jgi:hypothetical protein